MGKDGFLRHRGRAGGCLVSPLPHGTPALRRHRVRMRAQTKVGGEPIRNEERSGLPTSATKKTSPPAAAPDGTEAPPKKQKKPATSRPRSTSGKTGRKRRRKKPPVSTRKLVVWTSLEVFGLVATTATGIVVLLGHAAARFSGTGFFSHLLPFTLGVLGLILTGVLLLLGWLWLRRWLRQKKIFLPAIVALTLAMIVGIMTLRGDFFFAFNQFRILVGGREEAGRVTLAHQVFAAYRRLDTAQLQQLIDRSKPFSPEIDDAARAFELDPDLLHGIAATESSFLPRDSKDGGKGLFQITQIPEAAMQAAAGRLGVARPLVENHRHNGYLAAATLAHYLAQMRSDLFLGLLAYNIGPKNGGLRFIMQQYGATDFVTIQPYLQQLPRDYPIRVLGNALAFRLFRTLGTLPAYEEGLNAVRIQQIGIPGM